MLYKKYQIFVSYRREGGADLAGRIADQLKNLGYNVFFDVNFAKQQLKKHGEFYPYGEVLLPDNDIESTEYFDGNDNPRSDEVIRSITQIHKNLHWKESTMFLIGYRGTLNYERQFFK